jgi:hypothetical protein
MRQEGRQGGDGAVKLSKSRGFLEKLGSKSVLKPKGQLVQIVPKVSNHPRKKPSTALFASPYRADLQLSSKHIDQLVLGAHVA